MATGYIGTALVQMYQSPAGTMQLVPVKEGHVSTGPVIMVLAPPKLKLTVKRTAEIADGATATKITGTMPSYIIGFEGSGLSSDKTIDITTEWVDMDGSHCRKSFLATPGGSR